MNLDVPGIQLVAMRFMMNMSALQILDVAGVIIQAIALRFMTKKRATATAAATGMALVARDITTTTLARDTILRKPVAALLEADVLAQQRAAVSTTRQIATMRRDVAGRPQSRSHYLLLRHVPIEITGSITHQAPMLM
jgi:hypothetical protein